MRTDENDFSLISADLKRAFRESGCPICRLKSETVRRYATFLLAEHINDGDTRVHIVRSLGFCSEHTWLLYRMETTRFGDALGNSILYEDLVGRILQRLGAFQEGLVVRRGRADGWRRRAQARLRTALRLKPRPTGAVTALRAEGECRMCTYARDEEEAVLHWLVQGCASPDFRTLYAESDGLCLSHLRLAIGYAVDSDPDVARFLADNATARLQALANDLKEYIRKRAWQYRHEALTDSERDAPLGAVEFFGGQENMEWLMPNSSGDGTR